MRIILFTHPDFLGSKSMPRYAQMLSDGMKLRGHHVDIWSPKPIFYELPFNSIKKWLGYIDQYVLFPLIVKFKLLKIIKETLFVFSDQALGPWVYLVQNKPNIIHCHDFLALKSALGQVPENPISLSGKIYQKYIQKGFSKGGNFISVSMKTNEDLIKYHLGKIISSDVCYNGLNRFFKHFDKNQSRDILSNHLGIDLFAGYILHVGGNQYYKNRSGTIQIYEEFRMNSVISLPLLLIGEKPDKSLLNTFNNSKFKKDIYFIDNQIDEFVNYAYSGAICLLFPSLDEGFGWPIAEAMASGCIVVTTNTAPMNEVNGDANYFNIPRKYSIKPDTAWANLCAENIIKITNLSDFEREEYIKIGLESVKRFDTQKSLDKIESIYNTIILNSNK